MTDFGVVMMACPNCGMIEEDFDGFGFVHCDNCGWCSHISGDPERCDLCGMAWEDIALANMGPRGAAEGGG